MYDRILIPTDGSPGTTHVAMQGIDLAKQYGGTLHVINVVPTQGRLGNTATTTEKLRSAGQRAVDQVEGIAAAHDVPVEKALREGDPSAEILDYAEEIDADVIVAGTHGRTGLDRRLIGSVAERLVRHATCPVMTIRLPETEVTVTNEADARAAAERGIEERGYEASVTDVEERDGMWVATAETDGGELTVYVDAVSQRTMVVEGNLP